MSDARLFRFCLLASLLINGAVFIFSGLLSRPLAPPNPLTDFTRIRLVTLPPPPLPAPARRAARILPKPRPPKPPRPRKRHRPGARVHSSSPAPLAAPAGGSDAGAPAPRSAAPAPPPPTPAPDVLVRKRSRSPLVAHNVQAPPTRTPAPSDAGTAPKAPIAVPPAIPAPSSGAGKGADVAGKGAGSGEGMGRGQGIGKGATQDAGEPFGVGKGLAGDGGPRHVVYVLDISGSMTSRIDRAEAELRRALDGFQPGETFNIVVFSDEARAFDEGMAPATPELKSQAVRFLDTLQVEGGTNLEAALQLALSRPGVNEVILLTDGVPTEGETDFPALAHEVHRLNSDHARISAVGMVGKNPDGTDDSFEAAALLRQIARDSGGEAKIVTVGVADP